MVWTHHQDIEQFEKNLKDYEAGKLSDPEFTKLCRENGIYGIRGSNDKHMVRIKLPLGILLPEQCETLAEIAERFTPNKCAHITTRQDIQFHHIKRRHILDVLGLLERSDMTTREACGDKIRNVTLCPYAGVSETEVFDPTPYALGLAKFLLRNSTAQDLPRKFKIAFEGCSEDHARVIIHDIGFVASLNDNNEAGFRVYLGGGLGSHPREAFLFEDFVPLNLVVPTTLAIIRIFQQYGERKIRTKARLKFIVERLGAERVRQLVLEEREILLKENAASIFKRPRVAFIEERLGGKSCDHRHEKSDGGGFETWVKTNVRSQCQEGWNVVHIRCSLGDVGAAQLRGIASIAEKFAGGIRTTIAQNLVIRWVKNESLPNLYRELQSLGLAEAGAECIIDVTRCPGTDTCGRAITRTSELARVLEKTIEEQLSALSLSRDLSIKISGCPHACSHHHISDIGLCGCSRRHNGRVAPYYQLLIGGRTTPGYAVFGRLLYRIPAKRVPQAIVALIQWLNKERRETETMTQTLTTVDLEIVKKFLEPFLEVPAPEGDEKFYQDWGEDRPFEIKVGS